MAKARSQLQDQFPNLAYSSVLQSAANTLTFGEIQTGVAMFEKVAWIIHRINYYLSPADLNKLGAVDDVIQFALVTSDKITELTLDQSSVIDLLEIMESTYGTAGTAIIHKLPWVRDFTELPGGGIIIPPRPIFVAVDTTSLASAITVKARIYFTHKELAADEYWELVEATRIVE